MRLFSKLGRDATRLFNKLGPDAARIGRKISTGASDVLNGISNTAKVLSNNAIVNKLGGDSVRNALTGISNVARDGSNLVNYKNYKGGFNQVSRNILERAEKVKDDANNVFA